MRNASALTFIDTTGLSHYDAVCAKANQSAPHPTQYEVEEAGRKLTEILLRVIMDTALEPFCTEIVEGMIGGLHSGIGRLDKNYEKTKAKMLGLMQGPQGNEVDDTNLIEATDELYQLEAAIMIAEMIRNEASEFYTHATGETWTPWQGSQRGGVKTTFAQIEAKAAIKAKEAATRQLCEPGDYVVVFRGAMQANRHADSNRIYDALNYFREQFPHMKLATTGNNGAEKLAIKWAQQKGVPSILAAADFNKHNKAAPFRANDELLALDPVVILTLPATLEPMANEEIKDFGPCLDIAKRAAEKGINTIRLALKKPAKAEA